MTKTETRALYPAIKSMYQQGMKYKDIASNVGMSVGKVGMIIKRMREDGDIQTSRYSVTGLETQHNQDRIINGYDIPMKLYTSSFPHYKVLDYYNNTSLSYGAIAELLNVSMMSVCRSVHRLRRYGLITSTKRVSKRSKK
jgi:transposase